MKNHVKPTSDLATENLMRSKEIKESSIDPYESINGNSYIDNIDRTELNVIDRKDSTIDQKFVKDMDGDEDFYGDDEENQSGVSSYSNDNGKYLGQGDWADKQYGENQFDHKGDVDYATRDEKNVHGTPLKTQEKKNE